MKFFQANPREKTLTRFLINGVLFALPIAVTIFLINFAMGLITSWFGPAARLILSWVVSAEFLQGAFAGTLVSVMSLALLLILLTALGFVASWKPGRSGLKLVDYIFLAIPGVRVVYAAIRKMVDSFGDPSQSRFQRCVWFKWAGQWQLGFVVADTVDMHSGRKMLVVFYGSTPNPTTGFLSTVAEDETRPCAFSPQEGLQWLLSFGVLTPKELEITPPPADPDKTHQ